MEVETEFRLSLGLAYAFAREPDGRGERGALAGVSNALQRGWNDYEFLHGTPHPLLIVLPVEEFPDLHLVSGDYIAPRPTQPLPQILRLHSRLCLEDRSGYGSFSHWTSRRLDTDNELSIEMFIADDLLA